MVTGEALARIGEMGAEACRRHLARHPATPEQVARVALIIAPGVRAAAEKRAAQAALAAAPAVPDAAEVA